MGTQQSGESDRFEVSAAFTAQWLLSRKPKEKPGTKAGSNQHDTGRVREEKRGGGYPSANTELSTLGFS